MMTSYENIINNYNSGDWEMDKRKVILGVIVLLLIVAGCILLFLQDRQGKKLQQAREIIGFTVHSAG